MSANLHVRTSPSPAFGSVLPGFALKISLNYTGRPWNFEFLLCKLYHCWPSGFLDVRLLSSVASLGAKLFCDDDSAKRLSLSFCFISGGLCLVISVTCVSAV